MKTEKRLNELLLVAILGGSYNRLTNESNKNLMGNKLTLIARFTDDDMVAAYAVTMLKCIGLKTYDDALEILRCITNDTFDNNLLDAEYDDLLMVALNYIDGEDESYDFDAGLSLAHKTVDSIIHSQKNSNHTHLMV